MPRYKLTIEYDGGPYEGWQVQPVAPTIQRAIQNAATKLNGQPTKVYGAGRTDSGVHALGAVAHMDLVKDIRADKVRDALNFHLNQDTISILDAQVVPDDWHARFDGRERRYLYRLIDRRPRLALDAGRVWRLPFALNADDMHEAAQCFVGEHDFTSFRDLGCQAASPVRTIDEITILRAGAEIHMHIRARSFLHKQVRSIIGTLVEVGRGHRPISFAKDALDARDRKACGPVAPPDGLYLMSVHYEDEG